MSAWCQIFLLVSSTALCAAPEPQIAGHSAPGKPLYPDDAMRVLSITTGLRLPESNVVGGVIDPVNGIAYWAGQDASILESHAIGGEDADPIRRGAALTMSRRKPLATAMHSGLGRFFVAMEGGSISQFSLDPSGAIPALNSSFSPGDEFGALAVDEARGFLYAGMRSGSARLWRWKITATDLTNYYGLFVDAGDVEFSSALLDPSGYLYCSTRTAPARVVMFDLYGATDIVRIGAVEMPSAAANLSMGAIDPGARRAYFGNADGTVVQLALGEGAALPTSLGTTTLAGPATGMAIDTEGGILYVAAGDRIERVSLVDFQKMAPLTVAGRGGFQAPVFDAATQRLLAVSTTPDAEVVKFGGEQIQRGPFGEPITGFSTSMTDLTHQNILFGTASTDLGWHFLSLAPGEGLAPPAILGMTPIYGATERAYMHPSGECAFFRQETGLFVKVAIDKVTGLLKRLGRDSQGSLAIQPDTGVFNAAGDYAVFATSDSKLHKVAVGGPEELPINIGSTIAPIRYRSAVAVGNTAIFAENPNGNGSILGDELHEVSLGEGSGLPSISSTRTVPEYEVGTMVADTVSDGRMLFNTVKSITPSGSYRFQTDWVSLNASKGIQLGETLTSGVWNEVYYAPLGFETDRRAFGYLSFGGGQSVRIAANDFLGTPESYLHSGSVFIGTSADTPGILGFSLGSRRALVGMGNPSALKQIALDHRDALHACRVTLPRAAFVDTAHFYAHAAGANVRMALYDNSEPRRLLWQSEPAATSAGEELSFPVNMQGTAPLPAGDYWLGWQTDSRDPVASWTATAPSDTITFHANMEFGPAPAELPAASRTATTGGTWTAYLTYRDAWGAAWAVR